MLCSIILLFIAWCHAGVVSIEPPENASDLTQEQAKLCLLDANCWQAYLQKKENLLRRQNENLNYFKKQGFTNRGPFTDRGPFTGAWNGPPIPGNRPPLPSDFGAPTSDRNNEENRPPRYLGPLAIEVRIGQKEEELKKTQLDVHDEDGDKITYRLPDSNTGGFITEDGVFTYSSSSQELNELQAIEELNSITIFYSDGINPEQEHKPIFSVCACQKDSLCNYDEAHSKLSRVELTTCICVHPAYKGRFCNEDKNGCEDDNGNDCFPGTECIDNKAPMSGYTCGTCPEGYEGDGKNCEPVDGIEVSCHEIPKLINGKVINPSEEDIEFGVYSGQPVTYQCNDGYEMIGSQTTTCQSDGEFSKDVPVCRDINECAINSPCHSTARCRNKHGTYECYCDNDSQNNWDTNNQNIPENQKECNPIVGFESDNGDCFATSDEINISWTITSRWRNDPEVVDKFIVWWFPDLDDDQTSKRVINIGQNSVIFDDYEEAIDAEAEWDPSLLYGVYSHDTSNVTIKDLQPSTSYHVAVRLQLHKGTLLKKRLFCKIATAPGIPTPPRSATSKDVSGTSVTLSFLKPSEPRGTIENYFIEYTIADEFICNDGDKILETKQLCVPRYTVIDAQQDGPAAAARPLDAMVTDLTPQTKYFRKYLYK